MSTEEQVEWWKEEAAGYQRALVRAERKLRELHTALEQAEKANGRHILTTVVRRILALDESSVETKADAYARQAAQAQSAIESSPAWIRDTAVPPRKRC